MESANSLRIETAEFSDQAVHAAIALLGRELADLSERAEALDLHSVVSHLRQASELCIAEVPDLDNS